MSGLDAHFVHALRDLLEHNCRGKANARHGRVLLRALRRYYGVNCTRLRSIGEAMRFLEAQGLAIGSRSGCGYWVMEADERGLALAPEVRRIRSIAKRLRALDRALYERIQAALPMEIAA